MSARSVAAAARAAEGRCEHAELASMLEGEEEGPCADGELTWSSCSCVCQSTTANDEQHCVTLALQLQPVLVTSPTPQLPTHSSGAAGSCASDTDTTAIVDTARAHAAGEAAADSSTTTRSTSSASPPRSSSVSGSIVTAGPMRVPLAWTAWNAPNWRSESATGRTTTLTLDPPPTGLAELGMLILPSCRPVSDMRFCCDFAPCVCAMDVDVGFWPCAAATLVLHDAAHFACTCPVLRSILDCPLEERRVPHRF
mmetsp:Transcript_26900/g.61982  ORF Transcript_26900/g.61982 Transcript_26900/m.61982 type:complete len:254 (+) Transcript_26900:421-1182(+)